MANITETRSFALPFAPRLAALRADWAERWAAYTTYRTTVRELSDLSDRELADLGLNRSNIRSIAYEAAYKA